MSLTPDYAPVGAELPEAARGLEIADLSNHRERAEYIERHSDLVQPDVVSRLTALVPQLAKSDRSRALAVAEVAFMIASRLGDAGSMARSLRAKGNAHYAVGQNKTAIKHHQKAVELFRSLGDAEQVARTLSSSIQPLILQGRYRQASAAAREARKVFTEQNNQWRLARLDLNLGNILDRQDRFVDALQCYQRAYQYLSLHEKGDPEAVAVALHNIAVSYVSLNDFRKATATYEKARAFAAANNMPVLVGQADYNIAWLHYLRGNYTRAISMLQAARETCASTGDMYHSALCHLDLSEIYLELHLTDEAFETAERASKSFSQLGMQYEKAKSLVNMAVALSRSGNAKRALESFLQARRILVREKNKIFPLVISLQQAYVLFGEGRDTEARRLCVAALRVFRRFQLPDKSILCLLLLARLFLRLNKLDRARQVYTQLQKSLARLELPALSCQAYALKGQIEAATGRDRLSYQAYQRARQYVESLRDGIQAEELKISFLEDRVQIYEALIALCMKRNSHANVGAEVFGYVEKAKSRTLLESLSTPGSRSWFVPREETEYANRVAGLREELNWYFHVIEAAQLRQAPRPQINTLRAESRRRERKLLTLLREHGSTDIQRGGTHLATPLTLDQVRASLPSDVIILEYFQVQGQIVVMLLSCEASQIVPLVDLSQVSTLLALLRLQLSKPGLGHDYLKAFASVLLNAVRTHLQDLYKVLIQPIRGSLTARHLVIAPCGILHNLPFHALFDGEQYLIDEFTVSYAPSASIYSHCQARSAPANRGSLVLGISDPTVPFVQEEVETVATCLPDPEVHFGERATAECLRHRGPCRRFIHVATHGYFRQDNPMFSGIRLGDSYLSLYDLYQLELPAGLVALSGCSTGLNVITAGDELLGLARGLLQAGAETCLLTLWDVQDQSSAELMKFFYTSLAGGTNRAAALQQAIRQVKSERPHPYYWAPFILVGKA